jgi:hypothetical protein
VSSSRSGSRRRSRPSMRAARDHHARVHAAERRRSRLRGDLRRPRRRAVRSLRRRAAPAVDAREDGGARRHGAERDPPAGAARRLGERLDLAREVHERVMQRLFGVSLALSAGEPLSDAERERCRVEMVRRSPICAALERPLRRCRARPGRRWRPSSSAWRGRRGSRCALLAGRAGRAAGPRAAGAVGARRGAAQRPQARARVDRSRSRSAATRTPSRSRSATTACAPAARSARRRRAWGLRLAAFEALQLGGWSSSDPPGTACGGCGWCAGGAGGVSDRAMPPADERA